jgi:predicted ester cyclase
MVMVCVISRGTHTGGPFFDVAPTGKHVSETSFSIVRIAGGKIVEERWLWDRLGVWQQLCVLPETRELLAQATGLQRSTARR